MKKAILVSSISLLVIIGLVLLSVVLFDFDSEAPNPNPQVDNSQEDDTKKEEILPSVEIQVLGENNNKESSLNKLGTVKAEEKTTLIAEVAGRIENLNVELGQKVSTGDSLATLGNSLSTELLQINSNLAAQDKQIAEGILSATQASNIQEVASMQKNIENAYINYQNALTLKQNTEANLRNQIEAADLSIDQANESYAASVDALEKNAEVAATNFDNSYKLLLKQARSSATNAKLYFDTADLIYARINSKNSQIPGTIKKFNDQSEYKRAQHQFEKAIEALESVEKKILKAEATNDPYAITYAGEKTLYMLDEMEEVLVKGDSFVKELRLDSSLGLDGQISQFKSEFTQNVAKLSGDRLSLQQSLNAIKSTDAGNGVQMSGLRAQKNQAEIQVQNAHNKRKQLDIQLKTELDKLAFQVETARNQYESSQAQLNAFVAKTKIQELQAANSINQANKQALTTQAQLNASLVKAPISGTITAINIEKGDFIPQGQSLITIESTEDLTIESNVTEIDAAKLSIGSEVTIKNSRGKISKGKVKSIGKAAGTQNKLVPIEISITENNELKPNTFVRINLEGTEATKGYVIPISAVFFTKNSKTVYIMSKDGEIEEKEVKLKRIIGNNVEIAEGLEQGDKLIIKGARQLKAGDKVAAAVGS